MAMNPCLDAAKAIAGEDISDRQLTEIMDLLDTKAKRARRDNPAFSDREAYAKAAGDLTAERKLATLIAKRNRAFNILAKKNREKFYTQAEAGGTGRADAIRALNVGVEGPFSGAARSVDAVQHSIEGTVLTGPMLEELNQAGLLDVALMKNAEFEAQVAREIARANGASDVPATGNRHAAQMAEILAKYQEAGRVLQNKSGAFIRKTPGYITRQSHDQVRIYRAGKEAWKQKIRPLLDDRTFDGIRDIDAFLDETWANLASGNHEKAGGNSDWLGGFEGPGNLAKRASAERVLHFKDPDAWLKYNNEFGKGSLFEAITDGLRYAARNTALLRTWGTNPEAAFKADVSQAISQLKKAGDIDSVRKLSGWQTRAQFDEVSGGVQVMGNPSLATWGAGIRGITNMATLGGVVISALPDLAVRAAVLRHNGVPLVRAYGETVRTILSGFQTSKEKKSVARMLNIGTQGIMGGVFNRFHATDSMPGTITKANNTFFKVTLLTGWTDAWSRGTGLILANELGGAVKDGRAWSSFNELHKTTLRRYGIGEAEWGVLQKAEIHEADGDAFLMPERVRELPDEVIADYLGEGFNVLEMEPPLKEGYTRVYHSGSAGEGESGRWVSTARQYAADYRQDLPLFYVDIKADDPRVMNLDYPEQGVKQGFTFNFELTPKEAADLRKIPRDKTEQTTRDIKTKIKKIDRAREELATSLSTYYIDQVREALTFGGAKERAMLSLGTERGTPRGEAIRAMMQFKQFPLTMITKHINRELHRNNKADGMGLAHLIAATTALGAVSMIAKQYGRGQEPTWPEDAEGWTKLTAGAMTQGGGLGLYGDFLFGTTSRTGQSFIEQSAGPSIGLAQRYLDVLSAAAHGQDPSAKAVKAIVGTLPYNNLFGARLALDHMVLHGLQETLNPGYLRRYQRQQERDQNIDYWLEPTSAWGQ